MIKTKVLKETTSLKYVASGRSKRSSKVAISVTVWVLLSLLSVQLVWNFPKPLFLVVSGIFLFCSALFWFLQRGKPNIGSVHIVQLICFWIGLTTAILAVVYKVDKAGWNWFKLTGYNETLSEEYFDFVESTPEECVQRYQFISPDPTNDNGLIIRHAIHEIDQTVIIPKGVVLTIEAGAELRFGVGCSLVSYSPIYARGTADKPIVFTAKTKFLKWGVVGVAHADTSVFEHVRFEHARQARVNDIDFFAGLSVIGGGVHVAHSTFTSMFGKDAMNVQHGRVAIHNNFFKDSFKDGLDLDGGTGEVSSNQFVNCEDEGIDLSENQNLKIFNNKILDARGGRIAADHDLDQIRALNALGYMED